MSRRSVSIGTSNAPEEPEITVVPESVPEEKPAEATVQAPSASEIKAEKKTRKAVEENLPPVPTAEPKKAEAPKPAQKQTLPAPEKPKLTAETEEEPETEKKGFLAALKNGVLTENPVLRLVLGTCPTLATSTSVESALGMGVAATIVLICSNAVISALRKVIPDKVRIPAYITIIAGFVSVVQMLVKAFVPALDESLGLYLPLIVVNCIILGRAEMFASKNKVIPSIIDGLTMGIGFTAALFCMGAIREVLGNGSFLGLSIPILSESPILIFILPAGGFFVFGMLIALANKISRKKGLPIVNDPCGSCPAAMTCSKRAEGGCAK